MWLVSAYEVAQIGLLRASSGRSCRSSSRHPMALARPFGLFRTALIATDSSKATSTYPAATARTPCVLSAPEGVRPHGQNGKIPRQAHHFNVCMNSAPGHRRNSSQALVPKPDVPLFGGIRLSRCAAIAAAGVNSSQGWLVPSATLWSVARSLVRWQLTSCSQYLIVRCRLRTLARVLCPHRTLDGSSMTIKRGQRATHNRALVHTLWLSVERAADQAAVSG